MFWNNSCSALAQVASIRLGSPQANLTKVAENHFSTAMPDADNTAGIGDGGISVLMRPLNIARFGLPFISPAVAWWDA